jgi:hypothetical protein
MRLIAVICVLLTSLSGSAAADDTKPEDIVAKHLDSIGTAEARAAVKSRVLQGTLHFRDLIGNIGNADGNWWDVSEQRKSNFGMKFGGGTWNGEEFVFDGDKPRFAAFTSSRQPSPFGDFVHTHDFLLKEGLLGGELSTAWALENLDYNRAKLKYEGLKKIDGRELQCIEYLSKSDDMNVKLLFDPETHRHVMTVYSLVWEPGVGRDARDSAKQQQIRYTIEERFSDFQTDSGITLPRHYDLRFTQQPQNSPTRSYDWDMTADKVLTNLTLNPANFQIR